MNTSKAVRSARRSRRCGPARAGTTWRAKKGTRLNMTRWNVFVLTVIAPSLSLCVVSACGGSVNSQPAGACAHYVSALLVGRCGPGLPSDEITRVQARYEGACREAIALPGSTVTDATLDGCASALESTCDGSPDACVFRGTLPAGASCVGGHQCQSGACGTDSKCVAPAAAGEKCDDSVPCVDGTSCLLSGLTATGPGLTCEAATYG
jgi:hypothetical protein